MVRSHQDLEVWRRAVDFAASVYTVTREFPDEEKYGLISQMRRASVSVASNIAEGAARSGKKEFLHFLSIAAGSASEVATQLTIAQRIGVGPNADLGILLQEVDELAKMLQGLMRAIKREE